LFDLYLLARFFTPVSHFVVVVAHVFEQRLTRLEIR
jgi:hypothetical protein